MRSSIDEWRISRPLISVRTIAATIQTKSTETMTAVRVIIDAASESEKEALNGGAAISAVTAVATIVSARSSALRIDTSRRATEE